jgi:hypothetical protein
VNVVEEIKKEAESANMEKRFEWSAEIKFKGTEKEFMKLAELIEAMPAEIEDPEKAASEISVSAVSGPILRWPWPPWPGLPPYPERVLGTDRLRQLTKDMSHIKIKIPRDIDGGMRTAHVHIGNEIVLLDRDTFKAVVSEVASAIAMRNVDAGIGYVGVMNALEMSDPTPEPAFRYR